MDEFKLPPNEDEQWFNETYIPNYKELFELGEKKNDFLWRASIRAIALQDWVYLKQCLGMYLSGCWVTGCDHDHTVNPIVEGFLKRI